MQYLLKDCMHEPVIPGEDLARQRWVTHFGPAMYASLVQFTRDGGWDKMLQWLALDSSLRAFDLLAIRRFMSAILEDLKAVKVRAGRSILKTRVLAKPSTELAI